MVPHHTKLVALVDDDIDDRMIFADALEDLKLDRQIHLFGGGEEFTDFLLRAENPAPGLLFLDLNMPLMNGKEILKAVRNSYSKEDIFISIYSTSSAEKDKEECLSLGANMYLCKPNSYSLLKEELNRVLSIFSQSFTGNRNQTGFLLNC